MRKKAVQARSVDFRGCLISAKRMKGKRTSFGTADENTACFCSCNAAVKTEL